MGEHAAEIARRDRFEFGANWQRFLGVVDAARIADATTSLKRMLDVDGLQGKRFLDAGSGSGLFSLAAHQLGAEVVSFDYDPQSVACTREMRKRFGDSGRDWRIEEGSVLDRAYLASLGRFDVVYSWGVLHHTGRMWSALENVSELVAPGGALFIALYNDQGSVSRYWHSVKRVYVRRPALRAPMIAVHTIYPFFPAFVRRWFRSGGKPGRGMSFTHDLIDWLGGLPFEVATPEAVLAFVRQRGYRDTKVVRTTGLGCNEFVFTRGVSS